MTTEAFVLTMDPIMEAFFIAVAMEMGTKPGVVPTADNTKEAWSRVLHIRDVKKFMKEHPGAPHVLTRLQAAYNESGASGMFRRDGGNSANEDWFWDKLVDSYIAYVTKIAVKP